MHIFLTGGRGTGKTSAAKILARAINCLNTRDGEPCNECEICKAALSGSLTDIVEMDAASNNSVEDIRSIREEVNFLPTVAKYRVYIIDEVHMLSTGAFNALLKTLEEPPEHVKFILATTEPQRLPTTILSRCQRFDFKKISNDNIIKRLKVVCKESNLDITEDALSIIAILSEGAMRDALSILERCIQDGENKIDEDKVKDLVGIPKFIFINKITTAILEYNVEESMKAIDAVLNEGKDLNNFIWEIIKYIKDILLYKTTGNEGIYHKDDLETMKKLSENISKERLIQLIYDLSEIENNIKWSSQKLIMFQTGIIKLCSKTSEKEIEILQERINKIEEHIKSGVVKRESNYKNQSIKENDNKNVGEVLKIHKNIKKDEGADIIKLSSSWEDIINEFKKEGKIMLYTNLINTNLKEINDMTVGIEFPKGLTQFGKTVLEKTENMNELVKKISMAYGKEVRIKLIDAKIQNVITEEENKIQGLAKKMDIPINIIEE